MPKVKYWNRLKSGFQLNTIIKKYYEEVNSAQKQGKLTAAVSLGFPSEILYGFDIIPFYPQNHASVYAALNRSREAIFAAEKLGVPDELCSELKIALNTFLYQKHLCVKLPQPDMVLCSTNVCKSTIKFAEKLGSANDIPVFILDIPPIPADDSGEGLPEHHRSYITAQFFKLLDFLKDNFNVDIVEEKIMTATRLSAEASLLWNEIVNFSGLIPAPFDALDLYTHMFPYNVLRGREEVVTHYKLLKSEIVHRMEEGISGIKNERIRLLWDYMPIFSRNNFFFKLLSKNEASVVATTFFFPGAGNECRDGKCDITMDAESLEEVFGKWANAYSRLYSAVGVETKARIISELVGKLSIDGIIMHRDRSCKPQSLPQNQLERLVMEKYEIPCLSIEADSADPRMFSEAQITTRVEAFLESLI
ncbi:MAG: 2-hydroxyacyl-CoA dehydratase family protein [Proteobacteria bacterium]|nr:2-hydroxyacyl-CoA dehydratase family protein [Pseudomonadota bacterium]